MAKYTAYVLGALCLLALSFTVQCHDFLFVEGQIYCDTCRAGFVTRASEFIRDAVVRVECHNRTTSMMTYSVEARTDETGTYRVPVEGDHEEDICEVQLLKSPRLDCNEMDAERDRARVLISKNNGIVSDTRQANPLGFVKKEMLSICPEIFKEYGLPF